MWARFGRAGRAESTLTGSFCTRLLLPGGEAADDNRHKEAENSGRMTWSSLLSSPFFFAGEWQEACSAFLFLSSSPLVPPPFSSDSPFSSTAAFSSTSFSVSSSSCLSTLSSSLPPSSQPSLPTAVFSVVEFCCRPHAHARVRTHTHTWGKSLRCSHKGHMHEASNFLLLGMVWPSLASRSEQRRRRSKLCRNLKHEHTPVEEMRTLISSVRRKVRPNIQNGSFLNNLRLRFSTEQATKKLCGCQISLRCVASISSSKRKNNPSKIGGKELVPHRLC